MRRFFLISTILVLGLLACQKKSLGVKAYTKWVNENLVSEKTIEDISFTAKVIPADLHQYNLENHQTSTENNPEEQKNKRVQALSLFSLLFRVAHPDGEQALFGNYHSEDFNANLNYMIQGAQQDFLFINGKDTLRPMVYHFERNVNLVKYSMINLGFELEKNTDYKGGTLVYNDNIFGVGKINLGFPALNSKTMPKLKL